MFPVMAAIMLDTIGQALATLAFLGVIAAVAAPVLGEESRRTQGKRRGGGIRGGTEPNAAAVGAPKAHGAIDFLDCGDHQHLGGCPVIAFGGPSIRSRFCRSSTTSRPTTAGKQRHGDRRRTGQPCVTAKPRGFHT
jgi:hypothetical protein